MLKILQNQQSWAVFKNNRTLFSRKNDDVYDKLFINLEVSTYSKQ